MRAALSLRWIVPCLAALTISIHPLVMAEDAAGEKNAALEDVAFTAASDQSEQRYVLIKPADFDATKETPVLIALHGHGSDRWQFAKDNRAECRAARDAAAAHGMLFVSPDYRARTSWMGPKAESDVVQIIEDLRKQYRISKVVLCGGSMGGTGALTFTALHPDLIAGVAALNGTANLVEYPNFLPAIAESFGGSKAEAPDEYRRRSAEYFPEKFTMPLAITTGGKDSAVPPASTLRLADAVRKENPNVLVIHRPEGGHSTNYDDSKKAIEYVVRLALEKAE
jgi:pimeloyl-ACP methyl ester carboxylesterase